MKRFTVALRRLASLVAGRVARAMPGSFGIAVSVGVGIGLGGGFGATAHAAQDAQVGQAAPYSAVSASPACQRGSLACVDSVIREMTARFDSLAARCDHRAVFALLYLRTTEAYRRAVAERPPFFTDNAWVNQEDALFADYYFRAIDASAIAPATVPPAWQVTFDAAMRREVTGTGDILLGMNAHINRDLPFVLEAMGLTRPDGSSRKPDHDRINEVLRRVLQGPVIAEAARRFDPSIATLDVPGTRLDSAVFLGLVAAWRERAWHNAVRLSQAGSQAVRQLVANEIEQVAAAEALAIRATNGHLPLLTSTTARDGYCALTRGQ